MLELMAQRDPEIYMAMLKLCLARFVFYEYVLIGYTLRQHEETVFGWKSGGDTP